MRARRSYAFLVLVLVALACAVPQELSDLLNEGSPSPTAALPLCASESLATPTLISPVNWRIDNSLSPAFSWSYPDSNCRPAGYAIELSSGPRFEDDLGGTTEGQAASWVPPQALEPGKEYRWSVRAANGDMLGQPSETRFYYTGPVCDTGALVAPSQLAPDDEAALDSATPDLIWDYPGNCTPQAYLVDIATDPEFRGDNLGGGSGYPSTHWSFSNPLADCRRYFWRVAAVNAGSTGPYSPIRSFALDLFGQCAAGTPPAQTGISGFVWDDQCADTGVEAGTPAPAGCAEDGAGGLRPNGVRDEAERALVGVTVTLGEGACPAAGSASDLTGRDGAFRFPSVSAGTYCVSVDASVPPNDAVLLPGAWTAPPGVEGLQAQIELTLAEGQNFAGADFGWTSEGALDATPAGVTAVPSFTPVPAATITLSKNANCRYGPGTAYDILTSVFAKQSFPIIGRNPDSSWWYVRLRSGFECWLANTTGTVEGDISKVPIISAPPTPTPKPDAEGPSVQDLAAAPDPVHYDGSGCGGRTLTISAKISDYSGVQQAYVVYRYVRNDGVKSNASTADMSSSGSNYSADIDVDAGAETALAGGDGRIDYQVVAEDTLGQQTTAPGTAVNSVTVTRC